MNNFIEKEGTGLWVIDVQERLFPHIDRSCEILEQICYFLKAVNLLHIPVFVTEQSPDKLGDTVAPIKERLPEGQILFPKSTFSGWRNGQIQHAIEKLGVKTWILVGIEAHICVLQTAKDLLRARKEVIVLNDAVSSRSLYDFSTAMGELRDAGARISSTETVLYEIMEDAESRAFQTLFPLIREHA